MASDPEPLPDESATPGRERWRWHLAALAVLAFAAGCNAWEWLVRDQMPLGDFPGYVAQVQYVRDALLRHGRVPHWCVECYGGATNFTGFLKEYLTFPLALAFEPVVATKLAFLILKIAAGWGLYALVVRWFAAPSAGIIAGYALAFGAIANHQIEHLDAVLATALIPPLVWATVELLRRGGIGWAVALGVLAACQLVNQWVHALSVPALVVALAAFRSGWATHPPPDRRVLPVWIRRVGAALGVFFLFAVSQIAWIALDAENHRLVPAASTIAQRAIYIERSPFLFANRANVLAPWLTTHQPPGFDLPTWDGGRRYVGAVWLIVCAIGAFAMRGPRHAALRAWASIAGLMIWLLYWLSLGPRTLLWEIGESLHWSPAAQTGVRWGLIAASAVCALVAIARVARAKRTGEGASAAPVWRSLALSVALAFPTVSLWSGAARVLPMLNVQRSPGHFFDVAPVWLCLLFATALVAIERRIVRRRAAAALLAVIAAAVVLDFAPSRRQFSAGAPMAPLRAASAMLRSVPGDGGTLRIGMPIAYAPLVSWLAAQSSAGYAWGWLPWQSGLHWSDLFAGAMYARSGARPDGRGPLEPDAALLAAARVRYLLVDASLAELPEPWRRVDAQRRFALWEQPGELPIALGYRSAVILGERAPRDQVALASRALQANVLAVSLDGSVIEAEALRAGGLATVEPADSGPTHLASAPAPVASQVSRPRPERIAIEIDAGSEPAVVSVSESHHPWWHARVDGEPAPVLRANLALLAVPVAPGFHHVELRFERPAILVLADTITLASWIALGIGVPAALFARARRRAAARRHGSASSSCRAPRA